MAGWCFASSLRAFAASAEGFVDAFNKPTIVGIASSAMSGAVPGSEARRHSSSAKCVMTVRTRGGRCHDMLVELEVEVLTNFSSFRRVAPRLIWARDLSLN